MSKVCSFTVAFNYNMHNYLGLNYLRLNYIKLNYLRLSYIHSIFTSHFDDVWMINKMVDK